MQRSVLISILVLFLISCNSNPTPQPVDSGTKQAPVETKMDTTVNATASQTSIPKEREIFNVSKKMGDHAVLDSADYNVIDNYLLYDHDEDGSEGIGLNIFNYLKGNKPANESYLNFLNNKDAALREKVLPKLIGIMCIDMADNKYTYKGLVKDFSLFKESKAAEKALKTCIANNVED
ncbi:hypothetical protein A4D02_23525 [Niastella koreensis]|uniref:Lipoprotein n=2 Tax=Niastella koreensis TaxID=354356 RepID=G8TAV9_NIAKG|nr:hypothetical protein [Niastella koreensis]AEW00302.1 hypothetical protein Niako_4022 [Niastella koreensis GR20-10]OQP52170.1 hypothetical protein A4D02_23525 [Niastella koreensis]